MTTDTRMLGVVSRDLPGINQDNTQAVPRLGRRAEAFILPASRARFVLADQGTYFAAHNTTNDASTTLAGHAAPVLADADATLVKPFIHLRMDDASTKRAFLDFIEIEVVTAGANGTQACWTAQIDTGATRCSGGTALTRLNPNMASTTSPDLACTGGAITATAESALCRVLGFGTLRPSIEIAGDIKLFSFGGEPEVAGAGSVAAAAAIRKSVVCLPPTILGPRDAFLLALHGQASQDAAGVYKVRIGWWEV